MMQFRKELRVSTRMKRGKTVACYKDFILQYEGTIFFQKQEACQYLMSRAELSQF